MVMMCLMSFTSAFQRKCLDGCSCSSDDLAVNCTGSGLKSVPITFNPRLTSYIIRENDLSSLGVSRPFDVYTLLKHLDLSNNKLQEIPVNTFQHQKQLKVLNLSGNRLSFLSRESFKGLQSLEELALTNNSLYNMTDVLHVLKGLSNLEVLHLGGNLIDRIDGDSFPLKRLKSLDLSRSLNLEVCYSTVPCYITPSFSSAVLHHFKAKCLSRGLLLRSILRQKCHHHLYFILSFSFHPTSSLGHEREGKGLREHLILLLLLLLFLSAIILFLNVSI